MRLREAWKLSKTPYVELTYRSAVMSRGAAGSGLGNKLGRSSSVRSVMRGALLSKAIFTLFIGLGTLYSFAQFAVDRTPASLVSGVAFSLAITMAYLVLYSLQVLPSFTGGEPYALLSTLPLDNRDLSLVTVLSVARTFDTVAAAGFVAQVGAVAYLTASPVAAATMGLASACNAVFAVSISIWLSGVFQRNISRGGRGKGAAATRFIFLISWGLAAASLGFIFNFVTYAVPELDAAISGSLSSTLVPVAFSLVHPFTAGLLVSAIVFPAFAKLSPSLALASVLSFAAFAGYILLSYGAIRMTLRTAAEVARGPIVSVTRQRASEFLLKLRKPLSAYVLKDLRISSKNPSTAFIYALPVLDAFIVTITLTGPGPLKAISILTGTVLGCFFTLISASMLLNTEGSGLDYTLSLPLNARLIVTAKSLIATAAYAPVPLAIAAILLTRAPSSVWLASIPLFEVGAISASTSAELSFFIQSYGGAGGRQTSRGVETRGLSLMSAGDLLRLAAALVAAGALALGPLLSYGVSYVILRDHLASLISLASVSALEFVAVQIFVRRR